MANICDTQYKVMGERKAVADLWNTLQTMEVNTKNVHLYKLAEHYGIDYEKKGISVRGYIYWAEFEADEDICLLSFDTESAWSASSVHPIHWYIYPKMNEFIYVYWLWLAAIDK